MIVLLRLGDEASYASSNLKSIMRHYRKKSPELNKSYKQVHNKYRDVLSRDIAGNILIKN